MAANALDAVSWLLHSCTCDTFVSNQKAAWFEFCSGRGFELKASQILFGQPLSLWSTIMDTTHLYFALGRPFAPLYSAAMRLRETCYRRGIIESHQLNVPVISVGNLTMGGTGKTPMVHYLARLLTP